MLSSPLARWRRGWNYQYILCYYFNNLVAKTIISIIYNKLLPLQWTIWWQIPSFSKIVFLYGNPYTSLKTISSLFVFWQKHKFTARQNTIGIRHIFILYQIIIFPILGIINKFCNNAQKKATPSFVYNNSAVVPTGLI